MICICNEELKILNMSVNINKSCCVRIGKQFRTIPIPFMINFTPIPNQSKSEFWFLGMSFLSGKNKCRPNFQPSKTNFYCAIIALLFKQGFSTPESLKHFLANSK